MSIVTPDKAGTIMTMSTLETLGRDRLGALVTDWQRLLGLEHWTIRLELVRFTRPWQSGDIKVDPVHKSAYCSCQRRPE